MAVSRTTTPRRRRSAPPVAVTELTLMVNALIKENRSLKRQLAKLLQGRDGSTGATGRRRTLTTGLTAIQRKVERALADSRASGSPSRSRRAASASRPARAVARRSGTARIRRPVSPEVREKRLQALAKARAARAAKKAGTATAQNG